jgi:hypothetical protein
MKRIPGILRSHWAAVRRWEDDFVKRFVESFGAFAVAMAIVLLLCALAAREPPGLSQTASDSGPDEFLARTSWMPPFLLMPDGQRWYCGEWGDALRHTW